jgi:hypothetical protein
MGMFDEIKVEFPMPEDWQTWQAKTFQTKDLECLLSHFVITADGRLVHEEDGQEVEDYHGDIIFYKFDESEIELVYFKARFTEGICQWIRHVGGDNYWGKY